MQVFLVGGAVRDMVMGVEPKDKDYVVVGSNHEEMISLGYTRVGKGFPVYLHPVTKDEYALARLERKTGPGSDGFECKTENVTLVQDLSRRDLTCNAMAWDAETETYIDPFNGQADIRDKVLRHVSQAFIEDPLRVLRVARFRARFGGDWVIARETLQLIQSISSHNELTELTPERIWRETEKALSEQTPSLYFGRLHGTGLFPELDDGHFVKQNVEHHPENLVGIHTDLVMDYAAKKWGNPEITFACLTHDWGKVITEAKYGNFFGHEKAGLEPIAIFCKRLKVPTSFRDLALLACNWHTVIHGMLGQNGSAFARPATVMAMFERTSALVKSGRFRDMLKVCKADSRGRGDIDSRAAYAVKPYPQEEYLLECLEAVLAVPTKLIAADMAKKGIEGPGVGLKIRTARVGAITKVRNKWRVAAKQGATPKEHELYVHPEKGVCSENPLLTADQREWVNQQMQEFGILYAGVTGSHMYGLSYEGSDIDVRAIYLPSMSQLISGEGKEEIRVKCEHLNIEMTLKPTTNFLKNIRTGDTNALDILHSPASMALVVTETWEAIVNERSCMYSSKVVDVIDYVKSTCDEHTNRINRYAELTTFLECITDPSLQTHSTVGEVMGIVDVKDSSYVSIEEGSTPSKTFLKVCDKRYEFTSPRSGLIASVRANLAKYGKKVQNGMIGGLGRKDLSHAYRVLLEYKEILSTGGLVLPLTNVKEIMDIKLDSTLELADIMEMLMKLHADCTALALSKSLPAAIDINPISEIIQGYYFGDLG